MKKELFKEKLFEEEKQKELRNVLQTKDKKSAEILLKNGVDIKIILETTDLIKEEIKKIQESILETKQFIEVRYYQYSP